MNALFTHGKQQHGAWMHFSSQIQHCWPNLDRHLKMHTLSILNLNILWSLKSWHIFPFNESISIYLNIRTRMYCIWSFKAEKGDDEVSEMEWKEKELMWFEKAWGVLMIVVIKNGWFNILKIFRRLGGHSRRGGGWGLSRKNNQLKICFCFKFLLSVPYYHPFETLPPPPHFSLHPFFQINVPSFTPKDLFMIDVCKQCKVQLSKFFMMNHLKS